MSARLRPTSWLALAAAALAPLLFVGCGSKDSGWPERPGPKVVVSFAPLYCFAANVAGDDAVVRTMMGSTGPHDFQPTDADARLVRAADLFLISGLELDNSKADTVKKGSGNCASRSFRSASGFRPTS